MATAKTVKIQGTFEIIGADGTPEAKKVINSTSTFTEATQMFPQTIPGSQTNISLNFGGVALAKRLYLKVSYPVTLKFNQNTDTGFSFGPGDGILMSDNGITALFVSTGANPTDVELIVVE